MAKAQRPEITTLTAAQLEALLAELRPQVPAATYQLIAALLQTLQWVMAAFEQKTISIARLKRMLFGHAKETTAKKATAKKAAAKKATVKKVAAKKPVAKKLATKTPAARKPAAKKAPTKRPAAPRPPDKKPTTKKPAAKKKAAK
jgi:hypothetical protein